MLVISTLVAVYVGIFNYFFYEGSAIALTVTGSALASPVTLLSSDRLSSGSHNKGECYSELRDNNFETNSLMTVNNRQWIFMTEDNMRLYHDDINSKAFGNQLAYYVFVPKFISALFLLHTIAYID